MLLIVNVVMKSEYSLLGWKGSLLVPLHKNGDVEQVGNYRRIPSGCSVGRVFVKVLARRLERFAKDRISTEAQVQGWFRSDRCSDEWLVLRGVCEVWNKEKKNSYLAFLDISKAFGNVWREDSSLE